MAAPVPNPNQPYPYQPPPKKRKVWPWVVGAIVLVLIAVIGGCMALVGGVANEIDKESKSEAVVTYRVKGEGTGVTITYSDKDFNTAQETQASLPWEKNVTLTGFGKTASLTATNDVQASAGTPITCEIVIDGQVKNTQTSKGPAATASCMYSVSSND